MCGVPSLKAHETELKVTATPYMVAAFGFGDEHTTTRTASPLFMSHFVYFVAITLMFLHHTFLAELFFADCTLRG